MDGAVAWSMFFSSVVSFQYHPGTKDRLSLDECAGVADLMMAHFLARTSMFESMKEVVWRG